MDQAAGLWFLGGLIIGTVSTHLGNWISRKMNERDRLQTLIIETEANIELITDKLVELAKFTSQVESGFTRRNFSLYIRLDDLFTNVTWSMFNSGTLYRYLDRERLSELVRIYSFNFSQFADRDLSELMKSCFEAHANREASESTNDWEQTRRECIKALEFREHRLKEGETALTNVVTELKLVSVWKRR